MVVRLKGDSDANCFDRVLVIAWFSAMLVADESRNPKSPSPNDPAVKEPPSVLEDVEPSELARSAGSHGTRGSTDCSFG